MAQKVGWATAFSKTRAMVRWRTSEVVITASSCSRRRSNFSGVSLLRIPLTERMFCGRRMQQGRWGQGQHAQHIIACWNDMTGTPAELDGGRAGCVSPGGVR